MRNVHPTALQDVWFSLIALLWAGYFLLEGFDFGVATLLPVVAHGDVERRVVINSVGPLWDGNEVWLLVAGGATFAAFPTWYATVFSAFYLPLFLVLAALIFRGVAFEFRHRDHRPEWKMWWDRALFWGSVVPAILWGVAFADFVSGVPVNRAGGFVGNFWSLVHPYALFGGLTTFVLFALHGAVFLSLKTSGPVAARARRLARRLGPLAAAVLFGFLTWTYLNARSLHDTGVVPGVVPVAAIAAVAVVGWLVEAQLDGWAFVATAIGIVLLVATFFMDLFPRVLVSSLNPAYSLTIPGTASHPYTLKVMTIVAAVFTPFVLLYQGWTYWVFRRRLTVPVPVDGGRVTAGAPHSDGSVPTP
ncbi:MAG TPA: cytochrome d ubiquinol oxidase subunit II [Acidimicrobiales bacterium]|nr:cytochrome d ubiquinol oxidase subunit II [Acidimicrobiales bacterium]